MIPRFICDTPNKIDIFILREFKKGSSERLPRQLGSTPNGYVSPALIKPTVRASLLRQNREFTSFASKKDQSDLSYIKREQFIDDSKSKDPKGRAWPIEDFPLNLYSPLRSSKQKMFRTQALGIDKLHVLIWSVYTW